MYKSNYKLIIVLIVFCLCVLSKSLVLYCFAATETTKERAGFKLEGAVFHDELWEKYRVIAPEGGGGNGEGGGASGANANNAGNSGSGDSSGGIMGKAAGRGTTGSKTADQIRAVQEAIRESQEVERQKELETARDRIRASESIKERESIQESIKKRMAQESVKSKIIAATPRETIIVSTQVIEPEITEAEITPTSRANIIIIDSEPEIIESPTSNIIYETTMQSIEDNSPMESYLESSLQKEAEYIAQSIEESESVRMSMALDKKGAKGGVDPESETDKSGDSDNEESMGIAKEEGMYQLETSGDHAGKKVFLFDTNGNIGFDKDRLTVSSIRWLMKVLIITLFVIGALVFIISSKDKKPKKGYF